MRKISVLAVFLLTAFLSPSSLKAQMLGQVFAGYTYLRSDASVLTAGGVSTLCVPPACLIPTGTASLQTNGWELAGGIKTFPFTRLTVDISSHYGDFGGATVKTRTYMAGPEFSIPLRISPFFHLLGGRATKTEDSYSQSSLVTAVGGGLDIKAAPFFKLRLLQLDYLRTSFDGEVQHRPRISAGLVVSF